MPNNIIIYEMERLDKKYGSFAVCYKFKNVFHLQYTGVNTDLRKEKSNLWLIHKLIVQAINERYEYFSFGASTEDKGDYINQGLYDFKKGFGGGTILQPLFVKKIK